MGNTNEDSNSKELAILQQEWRRSISDTLAELRGQNVVIQSTLSDMKAEFVRENEFNELKSKVETLESDKAKVIGAVIVLQIVGSFALWLIAKLFEAKGP